MRKKELSETFKILYTSKMYGNWGIIVFLEFSVFQNLFKENSNFNSAEYLTFPFFCRYKLFN